MGEKKKQKRRAYKMHEYHEAGETYREIAKRFKVSPATVARLFKKYSLYSKDYIRREIQVFNGDKFTKQDDGQWLRTTDKKTLPHAVWELFNGKLEKGTHLRFIDGDRTNICIKNLEIYYKTSRIRICPICGKEFLAKKKKHKCCSRKCYTSLYRKKKKQLCDKKPMFHCSKCGANIHLDFDPTKNLARWFLFKCPVCNGTYENTSTTTSSTTTTTIEDNFPYNKFSD